MFAMSLIWSYGIMVVAVVDVEVKGMVCCSAAPALSPLNSRFTFTCLDYTSRYLITHASRQ